MTLPIDKKIEIARTAADQFYSSGKTTLHSQLEAVTAAAIILTIEALIEQVQTTQRPINCGTNHCQS